MARLILSLDNQVLAEYNMMKERYTIGRLPDNDVRIDNPTVSGHHALIINILNDSFLEDLNSTNGTYVNGKLIKKHALQHGDVITIGRHQLRFVDHTADDEEHDEFAQTMVLTKADTPEAIHRIAGSSGFPRQQDAVSQTPATASIQVLSGSLAGQQLALKKALTTMGREGVQVVAVARRSDGYYLLPIENAAGQEPPKVNGEAIGTQARKLTNNDIIELVGVKMSFFMESG